MPSRLAREARAPAGLLLSDVVTKWTSGEIPNYGVIIMLAQAEGLADVVPYFNAECLKPVLRVRYYTP